MNAEEKIARFIEDVAETAIFAGVRDRFVLYQIARVAVLRGWAPSDGRSAQPLSTNAVDPVAGVTTE